MTTPSPPSTPIRILLVEDNRGDRRLVQTYLVTAGPGAFVITEAETLAAAIGLLGAGPFDIVLLDLGLPDSGGLDTLHAIRAAAPRVPIIVFTGADDEEQALRAIQAGAQDYLVKGPLTKSAILRTVRYTFERHRLENALRESEEKFRTIADFTGDWEYWVGPGGEILYMSPSCHPITGYQPQEFIDDPGLLDRIVHPEDQRALLAHKREAWEHWQEMPHGEIEFRIQRRDGGIRWIGHVCRCITSPEGVYRGRRGTNRDITARKDADAEVRRLNAELEARVAARTAELAGAMKELESFSYSVSHDLRAPLRMISSFLLLLEKEYRGRLSSDADEYIHYAVDGATRLQAMISDLLAFSRVGSRGNPPEPTDCEQALQRALDNLKLLIEESGAAITHGPLPTVSADPTQLTQVLQNLIENSIKCRGEERPKIHCAAVRKEEGWLFSVADNGIGIEPRHRERIFQIFQRLHRDEKYAGTGIGLAVCRRIVERHGGRIWVESEPGKGAVFFFTLPG